MLMKAWMPGAPKREGTVLLEVPLTIWQRIFIHRSQAILVLLILLGGAAPWLTAPLYLPGTLQAAMGGLFIVVMLPLRYVFTDRGVSLNSAPSRLYKNFRRFEIRSGRTAKPLLPIPAALVPDNARITLHGRKQERGTYPPMTLYVPTAQTQAVMRLLKRYVR